MTSAAVWRKTTRYLVRDNAIYARFDQDIHSIAYLGIAARKDLLRIARTQRSLASNWKLKEFTKTVKAQYTCSQDAWFDDPILYNGVDIHYPLSRLLDHYRTTTREVVFRLSEGCHKDPAFSAVISNLCRSAPFLNISETEVKQNKIDSWEKEIAATQGPDRPPMLDYSIWFSQDPSSVHRPLSDSTRPAPLHNTRIRKAFRRWAESMVGVTLYPQIQSNKTVSRATAQLYHQAVNGEELPYEDSHVSTAILEKYYAETGLEIGGPCEIRQTWGYNDLTPRTYFAQGGKAFHSSKYIRSVFNSLVNAFPETNFISRFSINDLILDESMAAFVYDLISFTSNLTEFKYFLDDLADFVDDIEIIVVDSYRGPLRWSLGALIRDYNKVCNYNAEFSLNRYLDGFFEILEHMRAGFLGVYGNIAGSTGLHGLYACQVCGDSGGCKCVGDDVYGVVKLSKEITKKTVVTSIQTIGDLNPAKVAWWPYRPIEQEDEDNTAWPYCKRPFDRSENRMILEQGLYLPVWGLLIHIQDQVHEARADPKTQIKILASQVYALIRQCRQLFPPIESHQQDLIRQYLKAIFLHVGAPRDGRLPCEHFKILTGQVVTGIFLPAIEENFLQVNPWDLVSHRWENRGELLVEIPRCSIDSPIRFEEIVRERGNPVESCLDQRIVYLDKMDWVETTALKQVAYLDYPEYVRFYEDLLGGRLHRLYDCRLRMHAPGWITDLTYL